MLGSGTWLCSSYRFGNDTTIVSLVDAFDGGVVLGALSGTAPAAGEVLTGGGVVGGKVSGECMVVSPSVLSASKGKFDPGGIEDEGGLSIETAPAAGEVLTGAGVSDGRKSDDMAESPSACSAFDLFLGKLTTKSEIFAWKLAVDKGLRLGRLLVFFVLRLISDSAG